MAPIDIISSSKSLLGNFSLGSIWSILTYILFILLIVGGTAIFLFLFLNKKRYTEKIGRASCRERV